MAPATRAGASGARCAEATGATASLRATAGGVLSGGAAREALLSRARAEAGGAAAATERSGTPRSNAEPSAWFVLAAGCRGEGRSRTTYTANTRGNVNNNPTGPNQMGFLR
jgi:hypothetical protein